ncbi:MAG: HEAT repeat domain-containing protein [Actinomycetota bacterium]|nr:HEAT repeat domain-containing protein [Actinomycetota bacterium]
MKAQPRLLWLIAFPTETAAGWLLLGPTTRGVVLAMALHAAAVAAFGVSLLVRENGRPNWSWASLGSALSLFIFPLLGMLITAIAFVLTRTVLRRSGSAGAEVENVVAREEKPVNDPVARARELEISLLDEREVEPIVDVLREDDPESKRAAIEAITKQGGSDIVRLLTGLLHDPSPEARFFASISLSKLEDELGKSILSAQRELVDDPSSPDVRERLARLYLDYVFSGFLEGPTRDYYLELAREAYERAMEVSPDPDRLAVDLARVHMMLGDIAESSMMLDELARRRPEDATVQITRMEVMYEFGDFRELHVYARRTLPQIPDEAEARELVEWWAGVDGQEHSNET